MVMKAETVITSSNSWQQTKSYSWQHILSYIGVKRKNDAKCVEKKWPSDSERIF